MWKSHLIEIRIGNYELQRDSLMAFSPLFPAAGKNNYTTSVAHFLSILKKHPDLEQKLQHCASVNLARKGHYPAFDEALEMKEKERIDILLNEFLDPYTFDKKNRKINNRIDPLWKLIENLI
ncbi:hypothetical protein Glove_267g22 [Diversispora epigaea]|uniref:Uncharacterized protein n=1 Tax=Diversispora epigaea TaxID=1348612 RepID=A0A397I6L3_9GLOM|nr:hypothetical protein Glove_267g22 [Diversispora epigaea]